MSKYINDSISPQGLVEIKDAKTGEILRSNHNMVLKTGREFILNKIGAPNISDDYSSYSIAGICFGVEGTTNDANYTFNDKEYDLKSNLFIPLKASNNTDEYPKYETDYDSACNRYFINIQAKFNNTLDGISKQTLSSLAVILTSEGTSKKPVLFSRFTFDPIPVTGESEFIITYKIYI